MHHLSGVFTTNYILEIQVHYEEISVKCQRYFKLKLHFSLQSTAFPIMG